MKTRQNSRTGGFTLTEIMIVVAIIGLLAPIAIPNMLKARGVASASTCINNLRQIDGAKQQWALETMQGPAAVANPGDLQPYLGRGAGTLTDVVCPQDAGATFGTSYSIGDMLVPPSCVVLPADHALL